MTIWVSGMGIDLKLYSHNLDILINSKDISNFIDLPSIVIAKNIAEKYNYIIATEL